MRESGEQERKSGSFKKLTRREFLQVSAAATAGLAGLAVASCAPAPTPTAAPIAAPTAVPQATPTSPPPTATAAPTATPAPPATPPSQFQSGGLGLTRQDWEAIHGPGWKDGIGWFHYANEAYVINFAEWSVPENSAWHIERQWESAQQEPVSLEAARRESKSLIPSDSQLVKTYRTQDGGLVDLYFSESLKGRFPEGMWIGGEPGNFIVLYRMSGNLVIYVIIGIGNNP